jgi:hypothetical protein
MPDKPPADPADHAEDFSRRYAQELDVAVVSRSPDLGTCATEGLALRLRRVSVETFGPERRRGQETRAER